MKRVLSDKELLNLTEERAREMVATDPEVGVWALLRLRVLTRGGAGVKADPSTPSSQIPPYEKPPKKKGKGKKRGRKKGHAGARRGPAEPDARKEHKLERCPDCGGPVSPSRGARTRTIEDIEETKPVTTEHTIHTHYCPHCRKRVEPKVLDALPKSSIGTRAVTLAAWMHYAQGQTLSQIVALYDSLFRFSVTAGGLTQQWARLAAIFAAWHEQIAEEARAGAVLHADETGWRVDGRTHWLWCFASPTLSYYTIDKSRGSPVVNEFLKESYEGVLITDFYAAYNKATSGRRQVCLAHLLRELKKTSDRNTSEQWGAFYRTLRRVLKDALRLGARADRAAPDYRSKRARLENRVDCLLRAPHDDADCRRLVKRLTKHREHLFTFLDHAETTPDNNRAEREIRPAVVARKNSFQNASAAGARTQAILMSVYRTLKLRGRDPLQTIADALAVHIATGKLPPLPSATKA